MEITSRGYRMYTNHNTQTFFSRFFSAKSKVKPLAGEAYESCDTLPFSNFIELSVTGDLKWLVKSGNPTNLDAICAKIQSEYSELSQDKDTNTLLELNALIKYYEGRIAITNHIVSHLRERRLDALILILQKPSPEGLGFMFTYEDLQGDLTRTLIMSKSDEMKMNRAIMERDEMTGDEEQIATKKDWYARLSSIDKHRQSPPTNPANITVMQFIVMDSEYNEYISYLKSEHDKRSR